MMCLYQLALKSASFALLDSRVLHSAVSVAVVDLAYRTDVVAGVERGQDKLVNEWPPLSLLVDSCIGFYTTRKTDRGEHDLVEWKLTKWSDPPSSTLRILSSFCCREKALNCAYLILSLFHPDWAMLLCLRPPPPPLHYTQHLHEKFVCVRVCVCVCVCVCAVSYTHLRAHETG